MITRHPQKQESFIQIPAANQGEPDDKPLMFSLDESVDNLFKSFKEKKVLYIMVNDEPPKSPRHSMVTEKRFSATQVKVTKGGSQIIMNPENMLIYTEGNNDNDSINKRRSSAAESLKSIRERRIRESVESPRFGHGSRNSSITKKRSSLMPSNKDYDELELAYTITNMGRLKIFDKRKRYFSFNESSNHSIENSSDRSGLRGVTGGVNQKLKNDNDNYKYSIIFENKYFGINYSSMA